MQPAQVSLDWPGRGREIACWQQRGRLYVDQRNMQRFCDGVSEWAEDAQADDRIRILAGLVGVVHHAQDHRGDQFPHRQHRLNRIRAARLHELAPGFARHDLLDVAAQRVKIQPVRLDESGKVRRSSHAHSITRPLQALTQCNAGLDIPS